MGWSKQFMLDIRIGEGGLGSLDEQLFDDARTMIAIGPNGHPTSGNCLDIGVLEGIAGLSALS